MTPRKREAPDRLKAVFVNTPMIPFTISDAAQRARLGDEVCGTILATLELAGFIERCPSGAFIRRLSGSPHS